MERILVVDDDRQLREQIAWSLKGDYTISEAGDREQALAVAARERPDLLLLDLHLTPGRGPAEGMSVLEEIRRERLDTQVIVMTGETAREPALRAIEAGAYDYFRKPIDIPELKLVIRRALEKQRLERENRRLHERLVEQAPFQDIIGRSAAMRRVFDLILRVADGQTTVILRGESGTGKELVARAIHDAGRLSGPFVAVQCSALPEPLIESELFGHERGAFTGAIASRPGRFELADGGTLFLDEIGTLSLPLQAKLLRVLERREFERIGGKRTFKVNLQLITATNEDLEKRIEAGTFREDLYFRINVFPIYIPPLRERREDIPLLARHFLLSVCRARAIEPKTIDDAAMERLAAHDWRGNVRELENVVQSLVLRVDGGTITVKDLPDAVSRARVPVAPGLSGEAGKAGGGIDLARAVDRFEGQMLQMALTRAGGVKAEAARLLGIDKNRMMYLCRKHRIGGHEREVGGHERNGG
jgi:two-component system response regulator PilR (NtrC family)